MKIKKFNDKEASIEAALQNPLAVDSLVLDFREDGGLDSQIAAFRNLKSLKLYGCPEEPVFPDAIKGLTQLTRLEIYPGGDHPLKLPKQIYSLNLEALMTKWVDLREIVPLENLKHLEIFVKDLKEMVVLFTKNFTSLTKLVLFGFTGEREVELPAQIKELEGLEELELGSYGLRTLPDEFAQLERLRILHLKWLPMLELPKAVTRLPRLEELHFEQSVQVFPESVAAMAALRKLSISHGYIYPSRKHLKNSPPLSAALGKLPGLTDLNLDCSGVTSLESIAPLKSLKRLSLVYSGLADCQGLLPFERLEELNINECRFITDVAPLAKLPALRRLSMRNLQKIEDISAVSEMKTLKYLNIKGCTYIWNAEPLLSHGSLEELEANEAIMDQWNFHKYVPFFEKCKALLQSADLAEIESGLLQLAETVSLASTKRSNLFRVFGLNEYELDMTRTPAAIAELDGVLEENIGRLTADTLVELAKCSIFNFEDDNYRATATVIQEIVARRDIAAQERLVDWFIHLCEAYDPGHRLNSGNSHDRLIEEHFPGFEIEPLLRLLEWCDGRFLYHDQMDALFIAAFQKCKALDARERVMQRFIRYCNAMSGRKEHLAELIQKLKSIGEADLGARLNGILE